MPWICYRPFLFVQDKEVHVVLEDQQKINKFARLNNRWEELREEAKAKKEEIQTLEDAATELMLLEDDEEKVRNSRQGTKK